MMADAQEEEKKDGAMQNVEPSLWITDVREGSAAADAGLLLGDAIVSFGDFRPEPSMTLQQMQD